jgi:hypothetical protein
VSGQPGHRSEILADHDHLEMRLRAGRHVVIATLIDDIEMGEHKCFAQFVDDVLVMTQDFDRAAD